MSAKKSAPGGAHERLGKDSVFSSAEQIFGQKDALVAREYKRCPTRPESKTRWGEYIAMPLQCVRAILTAPQSIDGVFTHCLCAAAANIDTSDEIEVLAQVIYEYIQKIRGKPCNLPQELTSYMDALVDEGDWWIDEDKCGFDSRGRFRPNDEIDELCLLIDQKPDLLRLAREWFALKRTCDSFGLSFDSYEKLVKVRDTWRGYALSWNIWTWCKLPNIRRLHDEVAKGIATEFQIVVFCAYIGAKSVIGKKKYCMISKEMLLARMVGVSRPDAVKAEILDNSNRKEASRIYTEYSKRRRFDRLRAALSRWKYLHTTTYRNKRTYYSAELTEEEMWAALDKRFGK